MGKKIEDYLHLYLGCIVWQKNGYPFKLNGEHLTDSSFKNGLSKIILRPLSSQTKDEMMEELNLSKLMGDNITGAEHAASITLHRLKMGFDLFGLIDSGLAIDKTKLP